MAGTKAQVVGCVVSLQLMASAICLMRLTAQEIVFVLSQGQDESESECADRQIKQSRR